MRVIELERLETPIGVAMLALAAGRLVALEFEDGMHRVEDTLARRFGAVALPEAARPSEAAERLRAYFAGELRAIDAIAVDTGGTPFQQSVWRELRAIPPGSTLSYGALAARIGRPHAPRAVGAANGRNPISVVVPCHRLVGADASLVKYGGGLHRKRWLLDFEARALRLEA